MPLDVTFTLSDDDLNRFQAIVDKTRTAMDDGPNAAEIETAARDLLKKTADLELPGFIAERMQKLELVIAMINDEEWQLSQDERLRVLSALAYFCHPDDIIPDDVPGFGFLDDAIYAEIVFRELHAEISFYEDFRRFRRAEEARRAAGGDDIKVDREAWLADKRASLQGKMRKQRRSKGDRWRIRLW